MPRLHPLAVGGTLAVAALTLSSCSILRPTSPPTATPASRGAGGEGSAPSGRGPRGQAEPKPYGDVITADAETHEGMFRTHRIGDRLYFEIPADGFGAEMLLIARAVESTLQDPGGFFGGGARRIVQWEKQGDHVVLREKRYQIVADSADAIWRQVKGFRNGPVLGRFAIEAFSPTDSAAVIEVTDLFLTFNRDLGSLQGTQKARSWFEHVAAFPRNVEVEATQTGSARPPGSPPSTPAATQTMRLHWSMLRLPDEPMMPRLHDSRVGFISSQYYDFSRPVHESELRRFIHRFRLEPSDVEAFERGELVEPVEPIVYWIDAATPDWIKPWLKAGVEKWNEAFEEAGFRNAIRAEYAPTDDPDWSLYDARHSVVYWRPSTVANATGGQIVDPRSGEILKGEVNMYHNIMNLQRDWYFIQVSPLDPRAQRFPLPDSLMGRLVEYVVTHEIGHSIGFPHNMKASAMYPADSIRSREFLERMGGSHVATLMDYSRFNYVAQPEDSIPVDMLIPKVGPYDKFAVRWGYRPIPEADTPDEELPTLDRWARAQDTVPWFRFSTPDAPNDPENLTEAVGDADAVKSTTLGLENLERVMDMMLSVAERPGEDYTVLDELYGQAVGQWGRYMRHVAALIGGSLTQEKHGTGPRFEPVAEARQREAMAFLVDHAFEPPEMFLDEDILWRIEAEGVVSRIRSAQAGVLNALLSPRKLNTLVEYDALTSGDTYTLPEFVAQLHGGVWGGLSAGRVRLGIYRRNLQRAFLETVNGELNPTPQQLQREGTLPAQFRRPPRWGNDVRAVLREELRTVDRLAESAEQRATDELTRVHLRDVRARIDEILNPGG